MQPTNRDALTAGIAAAALALVTFLLLGRFILVCPDTIVTKTDDFFFNADVLTRQEELAGATFSAPSMVHPLFGYLWGIPGKVLARIFGLFLPADQAVLRDAAMRRYGLVILAWLSFNLVFHNVWGDEFFLYSPHWSWALMLAVLLGSRRIPLWAVSIAVPVITAGQLQSLYAIRTAILSVAG